MKLITEHSDSITYRVIEEATGNKNSIIEGIFMQAESKNRNGRIYPKPILEKAVDRYVKEQVLKGRAVGELDHPANPSINLDKVSHKITELRWEDNNVVGRAQVLNTPMGQIVKGLMEGGVQLGVSSRGMGSIEQKNGASYVKDDFTLATIDIVQDPSCITALVNGILEDVEWIMTEEGNFVKYQDFQKRVKKYHKNSIDLTERTVKQIKEFKDFLDSIS